jgi:hypothetical protein
MVGGWGVRGMLIRENLAWSKRLAECFFEAKMMEKAVCIYIYAYI